jgi:hypothetical protein|tara:strand:- start:39 stop:455 length:417 start_codon:yes stop_codon:yes gene_type:complete
MKNYIGTKKLKAIPMSLGDYNKKRGWTIPEKEDPNTEGYFVQYSDEYVSWSPKEVFEESYVLGANVEIVFSNEIAPHQKRVIDEAHELMEKSKKLHDFIENSTIFLNLDNDEKSNLKLQLVTMECYYSILTKRINKFK